MNHTKPLLALIIALITCLSLNSSPKEELSDSLSNVFHIETEDIDYVRGYLKTQGDIFMDEEDYRDAKKKYNAFLKHNKNSSLAYKKRGDAYCALKKYDKALKDYNKAISIFPNNINAVFNLAGIHKTIGNYPEAIAAYTQAIAINPSNANLYFRRALVQGYIDDHKKSLEDFLMVKKLEPDNPYVYYNLGYSYGSLEDHTNAAHYYREHLKRSPNDDNAYYNLAATYYGLDSFLLAKENYEKALKMRQGDDKYLRFRICDCVYELKGHKMGLKCFHKAIHYSEENILETTNAGYLFLENEQYDDAHSFFTLALSKDKNYMDAIIGAALTFHYKGNTEKSNNYLKQAIRRNPNLKNGISGYEKFLEEEHVYYDEKAEKTLLMLLDKM